MGHILVGVSGKGRGVRNNMICELLRLSKDLASPSHFGAGGSGGKWNEWNAVVIFINFLIPSRYVCTDNSRPERRELGGGLAFS